MHTRKLRRIPKSAFFFFYGYGDIEKGTFFFRLEKKTPTRRIGKKVLSKSFFDLRQKKGVQHFFFFNFRRRRKTLRAKNRVFALSATSLAAAVAKNGYFDPIVAPAQQRNS